MDALRGHARAAATTPRRALEEMDRDGVDAEVLYPTPRLAQGVVANTRRRLPSRARARVQRLALRVRRARARPVRRPRAAARTAAPTHAVAEFDRVLGPARHPRRAASAAIRTARSNRAPKTTRCGRGSPRRACPSASTSACRSACPPRTACRCPGYGRFFDAPNRIVQLIFAGVFDRFPALDVVVAEVDCGWVPYFKEQIDNNYRRLAPVSDFRITALPSEYVERHVHFTYLTDTFGIEQRGTRSASSASSGRATTRTSRATGRTRGRRSTRRSPACPPTERDAILARQRQRLYGF